MSELNLKILQQLKANGRATASEISKAINLSVPAVAQRIRKLEDSGIIEKYTVKLNRSLLGYKLLAFILVNIEKTQQVENFRQSMLSNPQVMECHHIAGAHDYLLKVLVTDTQALEEFLSGSLKQIPGVVSSNTIICLSTLKEESNV